MAEVTEEAMAKSWSCALEILRKYQSYSTSARRCVAAVELLYERVVSKGLPSRMPPTSTNEQQQQQPHAAASPFLMAPHALSDMALADGMNTVVGFDGFDLPDLQDMSWLNTVPSNLL